MSNLLWVYLYEPGTADPFIPVSGECHCTILNHWYSSNCKPPFSDQLNFMGECNLALITGSFTRLKDTPKKEHCYCTTKHGWPQLYAIVHFGTPSIWQNYHVVVPTVHKMGLKWAHVGFCACVTNRKWGWTWMNIHLTQITKVTH